MVDVVVVQDYEFVREIPEMQIDVGLDHLGGIYNVRAAEGVALAPGTERADVDQLHARVPVEFPSGFFEKSGQLFEKDRVAVIRFQSIAV